MNYGPHITFDLLGCNPNKTSDARFIYDFMSNLPSIIGMNKLSTPHIDLYNGEEYNLRGFSSTIHIVESHITFHFFDFGFVFGDIFSCKEFDTNLAINYISSQLEIDTHLPHFPISDLQNIEAIKFLLDKKSTFNIYKRGFNFPHMLK